MDYDNDGILDIISGSYDPGDIYLIRGLGDGKYAKVKQIPDESGVPLVHHPEEMAKYEDYKKEKENDKEESEKEKHVPDSDTATQWRISSFGSWPAAVDWDNDGDLDMLIGTFAGRLFLRKNTGTREKPKYEHKSSQIQVGGKPLRVRGHAAPVVADWDGDGLWDLVLGSCDGSVGWYRNTGSVGKPTFSDKQILVTRKADSKFVTQNINVGGSPRPGVRAQICVTDFDLDGSLDLIVGDYKYVNWVKELDAKQKKDFDQLAERQELWMAKSVEVQNDFYAEYEKLSDAEKIEKSEELREEMTEASKVVADEFEKKYGDTYEELNDKLNEYYLESTMVSNVWIYLRKPNMTAQKTASESNR